MAKQIRLYAPGVTPEGVLHDEEHAKALLAIENNGGWTDQPPLKVKKKDALKTGSTKKSTEGAEK